MSQDSTLRTTASGACCLGSFSAGDSSPSAGITSSKSQWLVPRGWDSLTEQVAQSGAEPQPPASFSVWPWQGPRLGAQSEALKGEGDCVTPEEVPSRGERESLGKGRNTFCTTYRCMATSTLISTEQNATQS